MRKQGFRAQKYREMHGSKNLEYKEGNDGNPECDADKIKQDKEISVGEDCIQLSENTKVYK